VKDIIFVNSHPIQYFAPLYKYLNEQGVHTKAWYCSDESIRGNMDAGFGVQVKWDIPLLNGYDYRFFKNYSRNPNSSGGFFGMVNFGLIKELFKAPKSVMIVHGYHYFTNLMVLLLGKIKGHTICMRCEMPQSQEVLKRGWKQKIKKFGLKYFLFPRIDYFLYIGTQNRLFYKSYGLPDNRLIFCPYSVDNERFTREKSKLSPHVLEIKKKMGIPGAEKIIMYSGKYVEKKRPMDILKAFVALNRTDLWLVMVGEGEMRKEMEDYIATHNLKNVILTGFVNQSKISEYYASCDVFVMCSSLGETWGLSVNEAMNFDVPLVISHLTGSSEDLVENGVNGYIFKTGDIEDLKSKLHQVLIEKNLKYNSTVERRKYNYSYETIKENVMEIVNQR
jgi:glycosyltransferase involved in cell wall biosynthesis